MLLRTLSEFSAIIREVKVDRFARVANTYELKASIKLKDGLYCPSGKETSEWIQGEHQKLMGMVSEVGLTFADGGIIEDVVGNLPELRWARLAKEFLHT